MAAANILAVGTSAANSSDIVVTNPLTVCLKGADDNAFVQIMLKDDAGVYHAVGSLSLPRPAVQITAPGTYRIRRLGDRGTCGVFSA